MRKAVAALLALLLTCCAMGAAGEKARGIKTAEDEAFHAAHLVQHLNSSVCHVTGNYIKVRSDAMSNASVRGHLEQADEFLLLELCDGFARIRVTASDSGSPDSWEGLEGWVTAAYVDCACTNEEYRHASEKLLASGYFPVGMPALWYFASGAGGWSTDLTIREDGSFEGYYHDWDSGDSEYPRGELQECSFSGQLSAPERLSAHEYRIVVLQLVQEGIPGDCFVRDGQLVTISHPYGIGEGDSMILYLPGTPVNRIPPAYYEWAYVADDEWHIQDFALYNMTDGFGWNEGE